MVGRREALERRQEPGSLGLGRTRSTSVPVSPTSFEPRRARSPASAGSTSTVSGRCSPRSRKSAAQGRVPRDGAVEAARADRLCPSAGCQASPSGLASSSTRPRALLTAFDGGRPVLSANVAIGARSTPTSTGRFYVNQRFATREGRGWAATASRPSPRCCTAGRRRPAMIHAPPTVTARPAGSRNGCIRVSNGTVKGLAAGADGDARPGSQGSPRPG